MGGELRIDGGRGVYCGLHFDMSEGFCAGGEIVVVNADLLQRLLNQLCGAGCGWKGRMCQKFVGSRVKFVRDPEVGHFYFRIGGLVRVSGHGEDY